MFAVPSSCTTSSLLVFIRLIKQANDFLLGFFWKMREMNEMEHYENDLIKERAEITDKNERHSIKATQPGNKNLVARISENFISSWRGDDNGSHLFN